MINILFNGHDFKFLNHLIEFCEHHDDYRVIMDYIPGHEMSHIEQSKPLLEQADIIFCEWALGNAVWYSQNKKEGQLLLIRLHHQEINLEYLYRMNWPAVDRIILICPENMEIFLRRFPQMKERTSLIYNVISCEELDQPKLPGALFNLGFIGTAPMRKSPHHALDILERLRRDDDRWVLYIKGKHPWEYPWLWNRPEERAYYQAFYDRINQSDLANSVVFDPQGNDMPEWFSKIGFILSTSEHEGSHQAVAEGMAAGSIPVIRNWAGADKLYPSRFVVNDIESAASLIRSYHQPERYRETAASIRRFARENFDIPVIIGKFEQLFALHPRKRDIAALPAENILPGQHPKEIRVVHLCYLSVGNQSGYEVRVIEETKVLVRQGVTVFIAAFFSPKWLDQPEAIEAHRIKLEQNTGAVVSFFPSARYFDLSESDALSREIDDTMVQLIALHGIGVIHGQALYSAHHALRIAEKAGIGLVFDNHGVTPEETAMTGGNEARVNALIRFEQETLGKASGRIFVSAAMHDFYRNKYQQSYEYCLIPCCVRSRDFGISHEQRIRLRQEKGFDDKLVILYLGTLSAWQWPEAIFGLFRQYLEVNPQALLYLLIPGYDHPRALEFLRSKGISSRHFLLEEVPHSEVGGIIGVADAGLLLREDDPVNFVSSPTKFGEYLASGVPVILTPGIGDYSAIASMQKVGINVNFTDGRLPDKDLVVLTSFLADVEQHRQDWTLRCKEFARDHLDWDTYGARLIDLYSHLHRK